MRYGGDHAGPGEAVGWAPTQDAGPDSAAGWAPAQSAGPAMIVGWAPTDGLGEAVEWAPTHEDRHTSLMDPSFGQHTVDGTAMTTLLTWIPMLAHLCIWIPILVQ